MGSIWKTQPSSQCGRRVINCSCQESLLVHRDSKPGLERNRPGTSVLQPLPGCWELQHLVPGQLLAGPASASSCISASWAATLALGWTAGMPEIFPVMVLDEPSALPLSSSITATLQYLHLRPCPWFKHAITARSSRVFRKHFSAELGDISQWRQNNPRIE